MRSAFYKLIFAILIFGTTFNLQNILYSAQNQDASSEIEKLKKDIQEKELEIKRLEEEEKSYRGTLNKIINQQQTLRGELKRIDSEITRLNYEIKITRAQLQATIMKLKLIYKDILDTQNKIEERKSQIANALKELSYMDDSGYFLNFLLYKNISEFFNAALYLSYLSNAIAKDIEDLKILNNKLEEEKTKQQKLEKEQKENEMKLSAQYSITEAKKKEKTDLLVKTKNQESRYKILLSENKKRQQEILKEIEELESELRRLALKLAIPKRNPGLFIWPIDNGYITQEYGDTNKTGFSNDFYSFHNGIDFGSPKGIGTPIKAVYPGKVLAKGDLSPYAYGKWVAIDHNNGLTTLYAHLSYIAVSNGQRVNQGDIIGYMGSTGYSTGPHLHLGVYATETFKILERSFGLLPIGASVNPRDYLPLGSPSSEK
jgi:murein DD-endopeptidase MepM/ murein hydrolase activator NlpD